MEKRHSVGTCLRHVSMQTARYQRIGNMPKACPYVMMQFAPSPIVVDINHRICQSKGDWVIFICAFGYLITEDWFFAEGERFFICWIHFNLIDIGFWGKKRPDEAKFIGLFGYFRKVIFTSCGRLSSSWHSRRLGSMESPRRLGEPVDRSHTAMGR